jgi:hypothetical protein
MDISARSKFSLSQFLLLFEHDRTVLLLGKYGFPAEALEDRRGRIHPATAIRDIIIDASALQLGELVQEIARTRATLRSTVSPRYTFDERWQDFCRCLLLDNYSIDRDEYGRELDQFAPIEPH